MTSPAVWRPALVAAGAAFLVALAGGLLTDIGPWYQALRQPPWKPPDAAFGPIWTTIFVCAAAAGTLGWRRAPGPATRRQLVILFAANAALNTLWSVLYFHLRRPDWALVEVPFLWLSVLALMLLLRRFAAPAAWLLAPYLLWVTIASVLNWESVRLNGPFG